MGFFDREVNVKNLTVKTENVLSFVKPQAMQDFGQTTETVDGVTVSLSVNCLKSNMFQSRMSVIGDQVQGQTGPKDISGLTFVGTKLETIEWVKLNLSNFVDSVKAMEKL